MVAGSFVVEQMISKLPSTGGIRQNNMRPSGTPIAFLERKAISPQTASATDSAMNMREKTSLTFMSSTPRRTIRYIISI